MGSEETWYRVQGAEPLSKKPVSTMLPVSIEPKIRKLKNRSAWLRKWIVEGYERDFGGKDDENQE